MKILSTVVLLSVGLSSCAQDISGKYMSELQSNTYLYLQKDSTFIYVREAHGRPVDGYEGIWYVDKKSIFFKPDKNVLNRDSIIKIEKAIIDTLDNSKLLIEVIDFVESSPMLGAKIMVNGQEFLVNGEKIILKKPIDIIQIRFFDKLVSYEIGNDDTTNSYIFYVYFYLGKNYKILDKIPFTRLQFQKNELLEGKKIAFKRVE